jgi:hypothetical protein
MLIWLHLALQDPLNMFVVNITAGVPELRGDKAITGTAALA